MTYDQNAGSADDERWRRQPNFITRRVAGQTVVVPVLVAASSAPDSGGRLDFVILNESGERLWEVLREPTTLGELARYLISEYDIDEGTAVADCELFLASLREVGAVALLR